jgi:2-polyprenyl-3-methyl-5-hydroxy-6-metoxy-1,4-benzoquinol methylase
MEPVEQFYDAHAGAYEAKFALPLAARIKRREEADILGFLAEHLPPADGARILELGCGTGLFTLPLARQGYAVRAVDISGGMLGELRGKLEQEDGLRVTTERASVWSFRPESDEPFDAVIGIGLLEYLPDPDEALRRAAAWIRPGGLAVFTAPTAGVNGACYLLTSLVRKRLRMRLFGRRRLIRAFEGAGLEIRSIRDVGLRVPPFAPLTRIAAAARPPVEDRIDPAAASG